MSDYKNFGRFEENEANNKFENNGVGRENRIESVCSNALSNHSKRGLKRVLKRTFSGFLLLFLFMACEISDNQQILSQEHFQIGNPLPVGRSFVENNKRHKVLVAVIDTGIDYNNPFLVDNMHFDLNSNGEPVQYGWDFVGGDAWSSPYLVRTAIYDSQASAERKNEALKYQGIYAKMAEFAPEWKDTFINVDRAIEQEINGAAYHGTHVAGLTSYDQPEIGVVGYRVLPRNIIGPQATDVEKVEIAVERMEKAIAKASEKGVKVINISLGFFSKISAEDYKGTLALMEAFSETVDKYPKMLFVTAAGNDGGWIDGESRIQFPCGVKKPNVLCVGSLREDQKVSDFSNIVLNGADIVFALGEQVVSTVPTKMCLDQIFGMLPFVAKNPDEVATYQELVKKNCEKFTTGLAPLSGTSMASPIVARLAAMDIIKNGDRTPQEVIKSLKEAAVPSKLGDFPVYKLKIEKPSWYGTSFLNSVRVRDGGNEEKLGNYWTGFVNK